MSIGFFSNVKVPIKKRFSAKTFHINSLRLSRYELLKLPFLKIKPVKSNWIKLLSCSETQSYKDSKSHPHLFWSFVIWSGLRMKFKYLSWNWETFDDNICFSSFRKLTCLTEEKRKECRKFCLKLFKGLVN